MGPGIVFAIPGAKQSPLEQEDTHVGTVVVVNGMKPVGLLTDRDIAGDVVGQGKDPATTLMGDVMRKSLTLIRDSAGILDVAKLFGKTGVKRLPVVNKSGRMVGIIANWTI
jgi:CBS domain-containing protein